MKILIAGASGKTGRVLLSQLSKTQHTVIGLIRNPEQKELIESYGAQFLLADLTGELHTSMTGVDAVFFVAGSGGKNIQTVDYQGLVNIVDVAVSADVKRFIYIGSINTGKRPEQYIQELKHFYQANNESIPDGLLKSAQSSGYYNYVKIKETAEKKLIASGLNYTVLRAGLLTQELGSGKVNVTPGSLNAFGKISRDNVAQCFIEVLENHHTCRKIYTILDGVTAISHAFAI